MCGHHRNFHGFRVLAGRGACGAALEEPGLDTIESLRLIVSVRCEGNEGPMACCGSAACDMGMALYESCGSACGMRQEIALLARAVVDRARLSSLCPLEEEE